jgi:hypothetical protein
MHFGQAQRIVVVVAFGVVCLATGSWVATVYGRARSAHRVDGIRPPRFSPGRALANGDAPGVGRDRGFLGSSVGISVAQTTSSLHGGCTRWAVRAVTNVAPRKVTVS